MTQQEKEILEFLGDEITYDKNGGYFWAVKPDGVSMIGEVRGYGEIQWLFKNESGAVDFNAADAFQDAMGEFIVDAIKQKIKKLKEL